MTFGRYFSLLLMLSGAGCGGETSAARAPASLACQAHDGRCVVCSWEENGSPRCRITIFSGSCPAGASPAGVCPALRDRSQVAIAARPAIWMVSRGLATWIFTMGPRTLRKPRTIVRYRSR